MSLNEIEDLLAEAVLLSRIGHPNIIRVFDANTFEVRRNTFGFFTMEYVAGGSLDQFWQSHGNSFIKLDTTVDIMKQTCRGLAVAHKKNPPVIHRDVKPQNILVGYDGSGLRIRLSDFGLAKKVNPLTLMASARGTVPFKSPEALSEYKSDSPSGDIWALGVTFYLLLTDRLPYSLPEDRGKFSMKRFKRDLIPPSTYNILVNDELNHMLGNCLSIDPETRYKNAQELLDDLEKWEGKEKLASQEHDKKQSAADASKSALGMHDPVSERKARKKARKAQRIAKQASRIIEAADLMEQAINEWPPLREEYEYMLNLWRRGLTM
jgi:serine/threonine-protein kinase